MPRLISARQVNIAPRLKLYKGDSITKDLERCLVSFDPYAWEQFQFLLSRGNGYYYIGNYYEHSLISREDTKKQRNAWTGCALHS